MTTAPAPCHHITVKHSHGELDCYLQDGCRCNPCRDANTARMREYRATRRAPMVPATQARQHIRALLADGHTWHSIATAAGLDPVTIQAIDIGVPTRGEPIRRNVRKTTEARILTVQPDPYLAVAA